MCSVGFYLDKFVFSLQHCYCCQTKIQLILLRARNFLVKVVRCGTYIFRFSTRTKNTRGWRVIHPCQNTRSFFKSKFSASVPKFLCHTDGPVCARTIFWKIEFWFFNFCVGCAFILFFTFLFSPPPFILISYTSENFLSR